MWFTTLLFGAALGLICLSNIDIGSTSQNVCYYLLFSFNFIINTLYYYYTILYYTILLYTTILYYYTILLYYTTILYYYTILLYYYTILYYTILYYTILYYTTLLLSRSVLALPILDWPQKFLKGGLNPPPLLKTKAYMLISQLQLTPADS